MKARWTRTAIVISVVTARAAHTAAAAATRKFAGWRGLPYIGDVQLRRLGSMRYQHYAFAHAYGTGAGAGMGAGVGQGLVPAGEETTVLSNEPLKISGAMFKKGSGLKNKVLVHAARMILS